MSETKFTDEELQTAFNNFDTDGSGAISVAEVKNVVMAMENMTEEIANTIVANFMVDGDDNNDKKITFQEFKNAMQK